MTNDVKALLAQLDLDRPGLEKVKAAANDPAVAARELLAYYRSRTGVNHPVSRGDRLTMKGKCAGEQDLRYADDALKHVFVGQPSYPGHFCGDDIDWYTSPVADREWLWQLHRMVFWDAMGRAYWHTGDEKYAREWCLQFADWARKNPHDAQHAYAWRSIEAGLRGSTWIEVFQRFLDSPAFTPDILVTFLDSLSEHARFLQATYTQKSNWGLIEAQGLAFIAMVFPEFKDADAWRAEAIRRLVAEIDGQVYPDGMQRELSLDYHIGCIYWFLRPYELAVTNGRKQEFPAGYNRRIEQMSAVIMQLAFPDATTPQFGDGWTGKAGKLESPLRRFAAPFHRKDLLYVASGGKEGTPPAATAYALEQSGLYSLRSSWDTNAICLVLKCGPDGGWHSHPDNGTFELYAGGRHLMPDSGCYIYSGDDQGRRWFRQTAVHQTLTLDGRDSAYAPRLLLWKPGTSLDTLVVENASYPDLTHRRAVLFVRKRFFVLVDEALGKAVGNLDLHFQVAPGKLVCNDKTFTARTDFADGWNVLVRAAPQAGLALKQEEGQVSFVYASKEPRPGFSFGVRKQTEDAVARFVTVVVPYDGAAPDVSAQLVGQPPAGAAKIELDVTVDGRTERIGYDLSARP